MQENTLFSPDDAASYLGIRKETLAAWRCLGRYDLPYIKTGRLVRYRKEELDAFLSSRTYGLKVEEDA